MKWAAVGAWYVVAQLVAALVLPVLQVWVFGELLPTLLSRLGWT